MAHPSDLYIKFLIAKNIAIKEDISDKLINIILSTFSLPLITEERFDILFDFVKPSETVRWHNPRHKFTEAWCTQLGIQELRFPSEAMRETLKLQYKPLIKEVIEILLLGKVSVEDIVVRVFKRFKVSLSEEVIELYMKFFWNVDNCSTSQWYELLGSSPHRDQYMAALQGNKNQAVWRAGFNPQVDAQQALRDAHTMIVMRLDALRTAPDTKETADLTTKYTRELIALHTICFGEGSQMSTMIKEFKSFLVKKDATKAPDLRLISNNGSYSNSGQD